MAVEAVPRAGVALQGRGGAGEQQQQGDQQRLHPGLGLGGGVLSTIPPRVSSCLSRGVTSADVQILSLLNLDASSHKFLKLFT